MTECAIIAGINYFKMAKKSTFLAYLLWLFGGVFGLHHFYLGRDIQAFLWWCTLGGYFGFGWLRDMFYIPSYVANANQDPEFVNKFVSSLQSNPKVGLPNFYEFNRHKTGPR